MSKSADQHVGGWQPKRIPCLTMRSTMDSLAVVIISLLTLAACTVHLDGTPLSGTQPLVKIGLAAPFEGLDRALGYEALAGAKLALAERNAGGGVGGYLVELVALDDLGEPDEARRQARELAVDPAVLGVVTGWSDETARASLPAYRQAGLPVALAWSVPSDLADGEAGVVSVAADTGRAAQALAEALGANRPQRPIVIGDEPAAALYVEALGDLGMSALSIPPPDSLAAANSEAWAARLILSRTPPPDALLLAMEGDVAGEVLLVLARQGWAGPSFGGVEVGSVHLVSVAGDGVNGLTFVSPAPAGRDVAQAGTAGALELDQLGPRAVLTFDATQVMLDALELAVQRDGYPSRPGLMAALPGVQRHGLTGAMAFDAIGRRRDAPVWLYRIVDSDYPGQALLSSVLASGK